MSPSHHTLNIPHTELDTVEDPLTNGADRPPSHTEDLALLVSDDEAECDDLPLINDIQSRSKDPAAVIFFVRSSRAWKEGKVPPTEAWLLGFCAQLQARWTAEFGEFLGPIQHITAVQSAVLPLRPKYDQLFSDFLNSVEGRRVELVVSGRDGFLTDERNFSAFLHKFRGKHWSLTVYRTGYDTFLHIDLRQLLAHWEQPMASPAAPRSVIGFAGDLRQASERRLEMGQAGRRLKALEPGGRNKIRGKEGNADLDVEERGPVSLKTSSTFHIVECQHCPREFPSVGAYQSHQDRVHGVDFSAPPTFREISRQKKCGRQPPNPTSSLQRVFLCVDCPEDGRDQFLTYTSWQSHRRNRHQGGGSSDPLIQMVWNDDLFVLPFECVVCGMDFGSRENALKHHRLNHSGRSDSDDQYQVCLENHKFKCPVEGCDWTFLRYSSYIYHASKSHPGSPPEEPEYREYQGKLPPNDPYDILDTECSPLRSSSPSSHSSLSHRETPARFEISPTDENRPCLPILMDLEDGPLDHQDWGGLDEIPETSDAFLSPSADDVLMAPLPQHPPVSDEVPMTPLLRFTVSECPSPPNISRYHPYLDPLIDDVTVYPISDPLQGIMSYFVCFK
ncbi:uncharacterized protein N7473_002830 [Penicillium subrubescens]|uniref:uncharacterized protein n=1 Tax=Penicillium subrubescens TaxID=1316194 RepID=UPI002545BCAC|nr:uncharacterized protein N7473_002830 [Penicillium subrubescens]KAJ5905914.1 hypothetical protein N7473_002830 [Penicillium subrubescens]